MNPAELLSPYFDTRQEMAEQEVAKKRAYGGARRYNLYELLRDMEAEEVANANFVANSE